MRLFDLHCDTLYECYTKKRELPANTGQLDLTRGLRNEAWVQVLAVWMPDTLRGEEAFGQCCDILRFAHEQAERYPEQLCLVCKGEELSPALERHCCAGILAVEGGSALAGKLEHIETLVSLGVKILTITWNGSNELGHGCVSGCKEGLTSFGKEAVRRMEQSGILPDVSHLNERGFWDVAELTRGPFLATHSVSAGVHAHPRNLTDAQFAVIRDRGGLVGLNLCDAQLGGQSFEQLERHWNHYLELDGYRTVGLGCDLDGTDLPPEWGGIELMPRLYEWFLRKNYEEHLLERLFFGNCSDFFTRL